MKSKQQHELFKGWILEHQGLLFKVIRAYESDFSRQDDLYQEIMIQLWKSIPFFKGQSKPSTWIYRVALNTAMTFQRTKKRRKKGHQNYAEHVMVVHPSLDKSSPKLDWLYEQIRAMDKVDRSLMLCFLEGFSYQEMGKILGILPNHIGVKLSRIKRRLSEKAQEADI